MVNPVPPPSAAVKPLQRIILWLLVALATLGCLWTGFAATTYRAYTRNVTASAKANLTALTGQAATSIDAILRQAMASVDAVASGLSADSLDKDAALAGLRQGLEQHPDRFGAAVTYRPYGFDPRRRLYSGYYTRKAGRIDYVQLDTAYDYTRPQYEWYGPALAGGARWTLPYYDDAAQTWMVTYSAPFYDRDPERPKALGVVTVDLSMDGIRALVEGLDLGPTGFGALVARQGTYLAHPDAELVQGRRTLAQVAREQGDPDRLELAERIGRGETGILDHRSLTTGQDSWLAFAPVQAAGWSLQNTFIKDDLPWDTDFIRHLQIQLIVALVLATVAGAALALQVWSGASGRLWAASILSALLLAAGIGGLWRVALTHDSGNLGTGTRICDKATLARVMKSYARTSLERHTEPPVFIPTGVLLESASFSAGNDLSVTGYVWQKYAIGSQDALTRGFTISEATALTLSAPYIQRDGAFEVLRWQFNATVRQRFDHSSYPLEQGRIGLRLLHSELNHNVVLVPDLAAYKLLNPTSKPGLEKGLYIPGWELSRSFFDLRARSYATNFGLARSLAKEDFPALHFNIVIRRVFLDAFISNLTSVIIVTILLFTLLMIASKDERLVSFMQAGSGRVLNICVGMFFVIAFSHIDIRRRLQAEEVFYLEYFYFLIYLAMLWVAIHSVLFARGAGVWLIHHRDNLIPRLAFWPVFMGILFLATLFAFR
jgi:hypothetical protein